MSVEGPEQPSPGLVIRGLGVGYRSQEVLRDVSLEARHGHITAVVGPNGGGKSTLLKCVAGLLRPRRGSIRLAGRPIAEHVGKIAYVSQRPALDWDFPAQVADVVAMGRYPHRRLRRHTVRDNTVVRDALAETGMTEWARRPIGHLSGGQQQRVLLARALAQEAVVLLLDEPVEGVDATSEAIILERLAGIARSGRVVLLVHHDLTTIRQIADHVSVIAGALVAAGSPEHALSPETIEKAYGGVRRPLQDVLPTDARAAR